MKRLGKKILAKYVNYIEIISYAFVVLFIGGLIALSKIKAEDEYVPLQGRFELTSQLLEFPGERFITDRPLATGTPVSAGDILLEVTADKRYIADKEILENLREQIGKARETSQRDLTVSLTTIADGLRRRTYPNLATEKIRATLQGELILLATESDFIRADSAAGGVFDFENCGFRVTEFPPDRSLYKKLETGQNGTATLRSATGEAIEVPVLLQSVTEEEALFSCTDLTDELKRALATFVAHLPTAQETSATLSVLVGWKSWMSLLFR